MILETAQLLCSSHWVSGGIAPYKLTHKNHPCSVWVRKDLKNYIWLCDLGKELCLEYTFRYGKIHKTEKIIKWLSKNYPKINKTKKGVTEFARAMPDKYKSDSIVKSYRAYYLGEKRKILKYTKREIPFWVESLKLIF